MRAEDRQRVTTVARLLEERAGLDFRGARKRWLGEFVTAGCMTDDAWFRSLLDGDQETFRQLCDAATVQESYFFREPTTLQFMREQVLPDLAMSAGPVRVWSAGCAGGEEAYTLAMLLAEGGLTDRSSVLGTDVAPTAVEQARRGRYSAWSLRGTDEVTRSRRFRTSDRKFDVEAGPLAPVEFQLHNLLDGAPPREAPFDLVLCRNVLIYLTPDAIGHVADLLRRSLRPGGWLITGISDPLLDHVDGLEAVPTAPGTAYRRTAPSPASPEASRGSRPPARPRRPAHAPTTESQHRAPATPGPTRRWHEAAERALLMGKPREAERMARQALAGIEHTASAHEVLVLALEADGRLAEALAAAHRGTEQCPLSAGLHALHAAALMEAGRPADARTAARRSIYLEPRTPLAHLVLARSAQALGDDATARRARHQGHLLLGEADAS